MAFNRLVEMSISSPEGGVLISDLDIGFNITRSIAFAENMAEFTVYNAKEETRKKILKTGANIIFKAGYSDENTGAGGQLGTIFIGNIFDSISSLSGPDWITSIKASSIRAADSPLENTYITLSYGANTPVSRPLRDIASALGMILIGVENATQSLQNGWTYVRSARGALNYLKNILKPDNIGLYIDNEEIVVYKTDSRTSRFSTVYLDYDSGLKSVSDTTEYDAQKPGITPKKIQFESLLIPKIQPNGIISIRTEKINGVFLVEKVVFQGDNFGGDFSCSGEAVA